MEKDLKEKCKKCKKERLVAKCVGCFINLKKMELHLNKVVLAGSINS